eukprot:6430967-Pyramimonas_sp.AAC.1
MVFGPRTCGPRIPGAELAGPREDERQRAARTSEREGRGTPKRRGRRTGRKGRQDGREREGRNETAGA